MMFVRHVRTIYRKELKDILRDRRTLIAMIVVPIVLYPLLMVGSIQAVSFQSDSLQQEKLRLGVVNQDQGSALRMLIEHDAAALEKESLIEPDEAGDKSDAKHDSTKSLTDAEIRVFPSVNEIEERVRGREIQGGVVFSDNEVLNAPDRQNNPTIYADEEEVRSAVAGRRLNAMFKRISERTKQVRLKEVGLPPVFVDPFNVKFVNLASPPSILGQILPLILVLMTITGAIYPAIDLTAGERERGTLESVMVCPVPVLDLIVGKFLVVTTIAIMGAALNLASVSATVYFGGFQQVVGKSDGGIPLGKMLFVLLAMIPFAVLMSAIMIAVCSFARTFKEAQNYVTPVIIAVLIPGGFAAFPATKLEGINLVMPVGNMVLLAREVLLGATVPIWQVLTVLLSTTLYAAAAVAIAANLFGQEAVLFSDVASLRTAMSRRYFRPKARPAVSTALLIVALLFPVWFFIQGALSPRDSDSALSLFQWSAVLMPLMFVVLPAGLLAFGKIELRNSFALHAPSPRFVLAAVLIGASAWIPLHELTLLQMRFLPIPSALAEGLTKMETAIRELGPWAGIIFIAAIPAVCEEMLFRGLLLGALSTATRRAVAVVLSAIIFGIFHFVAFRFAPTFALGLVLGFLAIQARSILPGILLHFLHNGLAVATLYWPWRAQLGIQDDTGEAHLPTMVLAVGAILFVAGLVICRGKRPLNTNG